MYTVFVFNPSYVFRLDADAQSGRHSFRLVDAEALPTRNDKPWDS